MKNIQNIRLCYNSVLTPDFLEKEYVRDRKSISQLSRELNIHEQTITRYLRMNNITVRSILEQAKTSSKGPGNKYTLLLTKELLLDKYLTKKKNIQTIADDLGLDYGTIVRYLRWHDIKIRSIKEQREISRPPKTFSITPEQKLFIDGLLLGDASIPKKKDNTAPRSLTQGCKHKEYLEYIKSRLLDKNITCSPVLSHWIQDERCKNGGYSESYLQTHRYKTFESFRERWYPKDKKIIPRDLIITSDLLLQVYLCDGNFYRHILLCTNGFNKEDVLFLKDLIEKELRIIMRLIDNKDGFMLAIKKSECEVFLDYIGPSPVKCYEYKWQDNESEKAKIRKNINARLSYHRRQNAKKENLCSTISQGEPGPF